MKPFELKPVNIDDLDDLEKHVRELAVVLHPASKTDEEVRALVTGLVCGLAARLIQCVRAEREKSILYSASLQKQDRELAAEREKVKALVEALDTTICNCCGALRGLNPHTARCRAGAALALARGGA